MNNNLKKNHLSPNQKNNKGVAWIFLRFKTEFIFSISVIFLNCNVQNAKNNFDLY